MNIFLKKLTQIDFCKEMYNDFNGNKENFDLKEKNPEDIKFFELEFKEEYIKIYNSFNIEILKLFKLLLNFGLYEAQNKEKSEFLLVLRHLILIFEFEVCYPEGQILLDRARTLKDNKGFKKKILNDVWGALGQTGKMLNVFQMFGGINTGINQKKRKREERY